MEDHSAPVYCPISGHFSFSFDTDEPVTCAGSQSQLSNCPHGYGLRLQFRGCSAGQRALNRTYQCLADWKDAQGRNYMALLDVTAAGTGRPRYRCAVSVECSVLIVCGP